MQWLSAVRSLRHHLWSCLRRSGSVSRSYVIICDHVFAGLEVCRAHYVIICDHVFAGLEVVLAHYVSVIMSSPVWKCSLSLRHHLWSCLRRSGSVVSLIRHHLWSCLRRSGSGVSLITSSSVIMSSPVWKWCLAHYVIICDHVFAGLEVLLAHYVIICDHVFAGLEVVSRSLRHHLWSCLPVWKGSRSLRHHLWSCLRWSGSVLAHYVIIVIMSSPVWKWFRAHYVIICDHVFTGLEVVSRSLRHHLWSCLRRWKWCLAHYVIICDQVFTVWKCFSLIVIICDHVFAGLEVFLGGRGRQCYCYLRRMFSKDSERRKKASRFNTTNLISPWKVVIEAVLRDFKQPPLWTVIFQHHIVLSRL